MGKRKKVHEANGEAEAQMKKAKILTAKTGLKTEDTRPMERANSNKLQDKLKVDRKVNNPNEIIKQKKSNKKRNKVFKETANESKVIDEPKAKKNIFVDDEPQEVPSSSGTTNKKENAVKKKFLNEDEAEVKEEDIDKFCDELDEEDNAQYEEWVKLIEANFHSNKKKPK